MSTETPYKNVSRFMCRNYGKVRESGQSIMVGYGKKVKKKRVGKGMERKSRLRTI
jgi:hypothetical protein